MTSNEYLNEVIKKYDINHTYNSTEEQAFNSLKQVVTDWFNSQNTTTNSAFSLYMYSNRATVEVQKSGSRAKGTAIKGSSDMDMFLSITDRQNEDTLKNYYNDIYDFLKQKGFSVRKQNVSLGVKYRGYDIDVVPAKKVNTQSYVRGRERFNDHYLWSNKHQQRTLTNIQKHIDIVQGSGSKNEIMLVKIWKKQHNLDFPSIYAELMVIDALNTKTNDLEKDFFTAIRYIKDNIENKRVIDPSNCNNIISNTLTASEKTAIKKQADEALSAQYWVEIFK